MTTASRSLATALPKGALRERLATASYTTNWDMNKRVRLSAEKCVNQNKSIGNRRQSSENTRNLKTRFAAIQKT
jgi:hypothetical protein